MARGVEEIIDRPSLEKRLASGKTLRVKHGIDPTSPNIHLGRSIPLLKLRDFQELGHKIVLIIGDFTGLIGDTSDKDSERPMLDEATVKANLRTYIEQASKILDTDAAEIRYNSEWLAPLGYGEIGKQADAFSVNAFIQRENIRKRLDDGKRVSLREVLYPIMQGYDSVAVKADVELGGTDQRFNLLAGRELQRLYKTDPQDIVMGPLIEGFDGRKMSSSYGNTVNFMDEPNDMFGKMMSTHDDLIIKYFTLLTRVPMDAVRDYEADLKRGANPRDVKVRLAHEIVRMYHGDKDADGAEEYFKKTFTEHEIPKDIPEFKAKERDVVSVLVDSKLVSSKSEARRAIEQKGVKIDGATVEDPKIKVEKGSVLQKGKIKFIRIV